MSFLSYIKTYNLQPNSAGHLEKTKSSGNIPATIISRNIDLGTEWKRHSIDGNINFPIVHCGNNSEMKIFNKAKILLFHMTITNQEFRAALGRFGSGVTVVTTKDAEGKLHGLTVSAFCSVSMNPPLILICIQKTTGSYHSFIESKVFVVNILDESQEQISNHFASHLDNKFTGINYQLSENGLPVLADCLVNLECNLKHSYDGGDHTIFVGEITKSVVSDGKPLLYWSGNYQQIKN